MTLNIAYFPPIEYFAVLARYSSVYVEACETYQKQSYRNRCRICTEGGVRDLNFPVKHLNGSFELSIKEILVDYSTPWLVKTKRCIDSAYHSSAFFDYYRDELYALLDTRPATLWELDMRVTEFFMEKIGLTTRLIETREFSPDACLDIHPKHPNTILSDWGLNKPYYQVFSDRYGFVEGLSVMDLLFNEGPSSIDYLL